MVNRNPYLAYRDKELEMSSPYELVGKLYSAASLNLKKAVTYNNEKKYDRVNDCVLKAQNIILELNSALDMQYDISSNLRSLYNYMYRRLLEGNVKKDNAAFEEISDLLSQFHETWEEAIKRYKMGL